MAKRNVKGIAVIAALIAILIAAAGLLTQVYAESPAGVSDISIQVTSRPLAKLTWDKQDCDGYTVFRNSKAIASQVRATGNEVFEASPAKTVTVKIKVR